MDDIKIVKRYVDDLIAAGISVPLAVKEALQRLLA
jgi:hypothetical protein